MISFMKNLEKENHRLMEISIQAEMLGAKAREPGASFTLLKMQLQTLKDELEKITESRIYQSPSPDPRSDSFYQKF